MRSIPSVALGLNLNGKCLLLTITPNILRIFDKRLAVRDRGVADEPSNWYSTFRLEVHRMVTITFPDREVEKKALAFLLGRFSGRVLRSGEHLVPEAALEALADQNIPFTVQGKTTYEQQVAAIRGLTSPPV